MSRSIAVFFLAVWSLFAKAPDPVQWTLTLDKASAAPGSHVLARFAAKIDPGWHLYSLSTPKPPIATTVTLDNPAIGGIKLYQPQPIVKLDPSFGVNTETFGEAVTFLLDIELKKDAAPGPVDLTATARYQCCNDTMCLPPKRKSASATLTVDPAVKEAAIAIPSGFKEFRPAAAASETASTPTGAPPASAPQPSTGFGLFLLTAFGAGLAAIFTPCVFPMIPFTVSYFVNRQSGTRRDGVVHAVLFCLGIIVLFTGIGALLKAIAGPFGVVQLGNSPWVNCFIAAVFIIFGLSLLGAYELSLPSGLLTKLNQASEQGGYLGTLLMGLTFTLTSFACIGPIVGPLLVASVQTSGLQPIFGMGAFATGLALPFFALALFPSFLQKLPKSGGWLMRVKVVLGFVVLAISVKYLSSADQVLQTNLISREIFLAAWVVLFALPGLYLMGFLRLEGIKPEDRLGVGRMLVAALFMIFSISLLPGLFGASLGNIEAFIPVQAKTATFAAAGGENSSPVWLKNQFREAVAKARAENKLVFVNFTGYACTNCHWMKANMFPRPEVAPLLKDFVLVDLYTDGTDQVSEENQQLEEKKFGTVAIPYYAILDPDEHVIATFPGLTRNAAEFVTFLKTRNSKIAKNL
ncbi:MAG TPA: cytochrome c biogenesis protein CcdA [Bryobacteraceae bacterium]|nr:cytochrome c biogenesis protein CcdA [Bryobacteraceae bacterium]